MNISPLSQNSFKGYDARPLKGFFMSSNCCGIAKEMRAIGKKEGFKVFSSHFKEGCGWKQICSESLPVYRDNTFNLWAQDCWMIVKDKLLMSEFDNVAKSIKQFFNLKLDSLQLDLQEKRVAPAYNAFMLSHFAQDEADVRMDELRAYREEMCEFCGASHVPGGNAFIVNKDNLDVLLVGKNEMKDFSTKELEEMFATNEVISLPQMDFHIDLFIRPLDNKRILLADDNKTLEVLETGLNKIYDYMSRNPKEEKLCQGVIEKYKFVYSRIKDEIAANKLAQADEVESDLKKAGFDVIRVPGRAYRVVDCDNEGLLQHYCNYINANVLKNKDDELVYITNKGLLDTKLGLTPRLSKKIGFSFEQAFVDSISPYIKKEHIYFVKGKDNSVAQDMLFFNQGGIHCACMEVPEEKV